MFSCEPDSPIITEMDSVKKMWMFHNWLADQTDDAELAKNHAYLLGSFWNPEAVQKMMGTSGTTHKSSDEEFDQSTELVARDSRRIEGEKTTRKRKKKLKV